MHFSFTFFLFSKEVFIRIELMEKKKYVRYFRKLKFIEVVKWSDLNWMEIRRDKFSFETQKSK